MTRNNSSISSTKKILVFILSILMCLSLFLASACKEEDNESSKDPEYSYVDQTDCEIDNPDFTYGTANLTYSDYPKSSITGWSISKTATSNSGVIDVSDKGWEKLLSNLVKDNGILSYVRHNNNNFTDADIKAEMIEKFPDIYDNDQKKPTTSQIREYIVEKYFVIPETPTQENINHPFANPKNHASATDNKVYMLNNYLTNDFGYGCAQSLTSTKTITLVPGEYAKISAYVKTENLNVDNTFSGWGKEIGANIRIKNNFNNDSQADFGIFNITDNEWTEYHFYVKADEVYETEFSLVLGLGYGDYCAEGTAYFDDITVELLDKDEYLADINNETSLVKYYELDYKAKENTDLQVEATNYTNEKYHTYDMSLDLTDIGTNYTDVISYSADKENHYTFTEYKGGNQNGNATNSARNEVFAVDLASDAFDNVPYGIDEGLKVELKKPASITIKLDNQGTNFKLDGESYAAITFFVKNQLNKLYSKDIVINVQDVANGKTVERPAVATISELSDKWAKYTVLVRNNFDEDTFTTPREFYLDIVIGPDTYQEEIDKYALGTVYISNPIVAIGKTYQYKDDDNEIETENYNYYKLFSTTADGSTALYSGYDSDYVESTTNGEVFNFTTTLSDLGTIVSRPAIPKGYTGIKSQHYYITGAIEDSVIVNENKNSGLINSKYIDNYSSDIKAAFAALNYTGEDNIQPLMITPLNDGTNNYSYGFISDKYTVKSNDYAKISVSVKVVDATAYIYLVDVSKKQKDILKFNEFTVNTASGKFNNNNQTINEKSLFFAVDESMMDGQEWLTVEFYIATGYNQKDFRVEIWNGERSSSSPLTSNGYVFVNSVNVATESAFEEPTRWQDALSGTGTPLSNKVDDFTDGTLLTHLRELTAIEKKYNADEDKQGVNVVYQPKYVWAQTDTMIYAIYNTIEPTYVNPYDYEPIEDEEQDDSLINRDPATFWLSFSSILLGVALVVAIGMLFIKNIRRRRKASKSDAKSHYTVRSRVKKPAKPVQEQKQQDNTVDDFEPIMEIETNEQVEEKEQSLDDYVYGDVQDFGENSDEDKIDE